MYIKKYIEIFNVDMQEFTRNDMIMSRKLPHKQVSSRVKLPQPCSARPAVSGIKQTRPTRTNVCVDFHRSLFTPD